MSERDGARRHGATRRRAAGIVVARRWAAGIVVAWRWAASFVVALGVLGGAGGAGARVVAAPGGAQARMLAVPLDGGTAPTGTALGASNTTPVVGETVTYTATVSATGGGATAPTGTVAFTDATTPSAASIGCDSQSLTPQGPSTAVATCQVTYTAPAPHTISAAYSGDATFANSASSPVDVTVGQDTPKVQLTPSPGSSSANAPISYTATVTPTYSGVYPTGSVTVLAGSTALCTATLTPDSPGSDSVATCTATSTTPPQSVTAQYSGDSNFAAGQPSNELWAPSSTALQATSTGLVTNQTTTLAATVTGSNGPVTGTVAFLDGGQAISGCAAQPVSVTTGQATCQPAFPAGTHDLSAAYTPGGSAYGPSQQPSPVTITVAKAPTLTLLTASTTAPAASHPVTFTATVRPQPAGAARATGSVQFLDGSTPITCDSGNPLTPDSTDSNSTATCTVSYALAGTHSITARYGGDSNFLTGASGPLAITVPAVVAATTLAPAAVTMTTAALRGTLTASGVPVYWQFQYGPVAPIYGTKKQGPVYATRSVSALITGLSPATTYHYDLIAITGGQPTFGRLLSFTTLALGALELAFPATATAHSGRLALPVQCRSARTCTGHLGLSAVSGHATVSCAYPAYRVAAGRQAPVTATLSAACRSLGRQHGNRLTLTAVSHPTSPQFSARRTLTVLLR